MKDKKKSLTSSEKIAAKTEGFLSRNYRLLIIVLVIVVLVVAALGIWSFVSGNDREEVATAVYDLEQHYNDLLLIDETSADFETAGSQLVSDAQAILAAVDGNEYAGLKTNYILGEYYFLTGDYTSALSCFETVAADGSGTYFGSLALANAAASAENAGDQDSALAYYNRIWDEYGTEAPESPKALFNAARIYEAQGDTELASATYAQLADEFTSSEYAQLANARLIVLGH